MPLTLYMAPFSPPVRSVLMTAEALGVKLELKNIQFADGEHLTPDYQKMNPQHTIPTLDDNGQIIWDSHAINAYLVSKYGKDDSLYPKDLFQRAIVDQRLHFDTGVAFPSLRVPVREMKYNGLKKLTDAHIAAFHEVYDFLEKFLTGNEWVAGKNLTIADINLLATVSTMNEIIAVDGEKYPNVKRWFENGQQLPFYEVNKPGLSEITKILKKISLNN